MIPFAVDHCAHFGLHPFACPGLAELALGTQLPHFHRGTKPCDIAFAVECWTSNWTSLQIIVFINRGEESVILIVTASVVQEDRQITQMLLDLNQVWRKFSCVRRLPDEPSIGKTLYGTTCAAVHHRINGAGYRYSAIATSR